MIDGFSILLTHGLMLLAAWRMLSRPDLDREDGGADKGFAARRKP
ncbi:hypothetical protein [Sphingomonas spermidinifaciens]|nr:hypothetical protein [Sphingomonas spermidinifaciens]